MKTFQIICCLIFCQFLFAQNDTTLISKPKLGLVSVDKLNVVYRGILNPISIAVPNAKSFTVSGLGVKEEDGKYYIAPGSGNEMFVTLEIILEDDSKVVEEHVFRIQSIQYPIVKINKMNCDSCYVNVTLANLKNAIISVHFEDFLFDYKFEVTRFVIKYPKKPAILVEGNTIDENTLKKIKKFKKGEIITIGAVKYKIHPDIPAFWPTPTPILLIITD
ncbi:GldM family protein [Flavobacterium orientale]|uniref:Gliding motility-associated protein GldM C-terminal domain-containing protein n=1 Tax=Flavobacterium orientale TaxID=1756020 RepID=A0A917DAF4_9FLAO|nr:GldM family protein [Flavobacterium orientale]GGD22455.1 hypothetical protein GCM10011343_10830 [Flavobacterium orientale]